MCRMLAYGVFSGLLLTSHLVQASEFPLTTSRCFASTATPVIAYTSSHKASAMSADARYRAPTTSPRLETLDVLSIGMSLDVFRQGQSWQALQEQNAKQPEALHVGSILPIDPKKYPVAADDKDMAYEKRETDALELGLRDFLEKWPIPTITVVRGWNPKTPNLRFTPERTQRSLSVMVNDMRTPAGLHWHRIRNLEDGIICNDTPEGVMESLFQMFEQNPDLPAVLVYTNEGFSMSYALSSRSTVLVGGQGHVKLENSPTPWSPWSSAAPNVSSGCATTLSSPRSTTTRLTPNSEAGACVNLRWNSSHRNSFHSPGPNELSSNGMRCQYWPEFTVQSSCRCNAPIPVNA